MYQINADKANRDSLIDGPISGYSSAGVVRRAYAECIHSTPDEVYVYTEYIGSTPDEV